MSETGSDSSKARPKPQTMPHKWSVRPATEADLEDICRIYNHEVEHGISTLDTEPWDAASKGPWLADHGPGQYPLLVAEQDGLLGWGCLSRWSPKAGYDGTVEASLFVAPTARGHGVGGTLLRSLLESARQIGYHVVLGRIVDRNEGSLRLFYAHGFQPVGVMREVGEKFGEKLNVVLIQQRLKPA